MDQEMSLMQAAMTGEEEGRLDTGASATGAAVNGDDDNNDDGLRQQAALQLRVQKRLGLSRDQAREVTSRRRRACVAALTLSRLPSTWPSHCTSLAHVCADPWRQPRRP